MSYMVENREVSESEVNMLKQQYCMPAVEQANTRLNDNLSDLKVFATFFCYRKIHSKNGTLGTSLI